MGHIQDSAELGNETLTLLFLGTQTEKKVQV